jgi:hypothetical protein
LCQGTALAVPQRKQNQRGHQPPEGTPSFDFDLFRDAPTFTFEGEDAILVDYQDYH